MFSHTVSSVTHIFASKTLHHALKHACCPLHLNVQHCRTHRRDSLHCCSLSRATIMTSASLFTIYQLSLWPIFWSAFTTNHKPIYSEVRLNCIWSLQSISKKKNIPFSLQTVSSFSSCVFESHLCKFGPSSVIDTVCLAVLPVPHKKLKNQQKCSVLLCHEAWHCPELHTEMLSRV